MTVCRLRVPTVLQRGEQPFVEISFDEDAWRLDLSSLRLVREWMRAAARWLGSSEAVRFGGALERALDSVRSSPPRRLDDHFVNLVEGRLSSGEPSWLEVRVQSAVAQPQHPRIVLDCAESPDAIGTEDTWWIDGREAAQLAQLMRHALSLLGGARARAVGALDEASVEAVPFLSVAVSVDPVEEKSFGVELRFSDELLEERGDDGVLWLDATAATKLADALDDAARWAAAHPPHVFTPPEPEPRLVDELRL